MVAVIIAAAGGGSRLGRAETKPFVLLGNKPILAYSLTLFAEMPEVGLIIVATDPQKELNINHMVQRLGITKKVKVVAGGAKRQDSVAAGLTVLPKKVELVAIHDAARPLVSRKMASQLLAAGREGAAIPVLPVIDTLKEVADGFVGHTLDRKSIVSVQTPQVFLRHIICTSYREAEKSGFYGTDDAALVEAAGFPVKVLVGERTNIKITYPEDIIIAETLLKKRGDISWERLNYGVSD